MSDSMSDEPTPPQPAPGPAEAPAAWAQPAGPQDAPPPSTAPADEADAGPAPTTSKAGRNLPVALAAGVFLLGLIAASLVFAKWLFAIVGVVAVWLGVVELSRAMRQHGYRISIQPILLSLPIIAFVAYNVGPIGHLVAFATLVLVLFLFRLAFGVKGYVRDVTGSVFVAAYLPLMLGFAILTLGTTDGAWLIATFVLLTVGSDIGGYAAGVLFGKHPMAASISPKKSWEGFSGSVGVQAILGALLFAFALDAEWWQGVIVGVAMTITATLGDFVESAVKRDLGVKDMGDIVPGHGGIMDRLDSLIPNAFVSWAFFTWFLGI